MSEYQKQLSADLTRARKATDLEIKELEKKVPGAEKKLAALEIQYKKNSDLIDRLRVDFTGLEAKVTEGEEKSAAAKQRLLADFKTGELDAEAYRIEGEALDKRQAALEAKYATSLRELFTACREKGIAQLAQELTLLEAREDVAYLVSQPRYLEIKHLRGRIAELEADITTLGQNPAATNDEKRRLRFTIGQAESGNIVQGCQFYNVTPDKIRDVIRWDINIPPSMIPELMKFREFMLAEGMEEMDLPLTLTPDNKGGAYWNCPLKTSSKSIQPPGGLQ